MDAMRRRYAGTGELSPLQLGHLTIVKLARLAGDTLPDASVSVSTARYLPGFSAFEPTLPENAVLRAPAAAGNLIALPTDTYRVQPLRFLFLLVCLTHLLPNFRPLVGFSI